MRSKAGGDHFVADSADAVFRQVEIEQNPATLLLLPGDQRLGKSFRCSLDNPIRAPRVGR